MIYPDYSPQPLGELQARYPAAVAKAFGVAEILSLGGPLGPEHTFDFEDGLRLTISRERFAGRDEIHVSASYRPDSPMAHDVVSKLRACRSRVGRDAVRDEWIASIEARFRELSGSTARFPAAEMSERGVPHWRL